jgi:hypothetical protein
MMYSTKVAAIKIQDMADKLYETMLQTSAAVNFISQSIESVKQKTLTQARPGTTFPTSPRTCQSSRFRAEE